MIPRAFSAGVAVSLLAAAMAMTTTTTSTAAPAASNTTSPTHFALTSSGYGTRVSGGDIPAGSDRTAYQVIGCTNMAGVDIDNFEAASDLGPLGSLSGVKTRTWTTEKDGVVSAWASNRIAGAMLGDEVSGGLLLEGVKSTSRAYHDQSGFHAATTRTVAGIRLAPAGGGEPQELEIPSPGETLVIPGVARISLGMNTKSATAGRAAAKAEALRVELIPSGTKVYMARSQAAIERGVRSGLFRGYSYGSRFKGLDGTLESKMTPFLKMPCQGTDGEVKSQDIARVDADGLVIKQLSTQHSADQSARHAVAHEESRVDRFNLRGGEVTARGVVGRANIRFEKGSGTTKNIKGSKIGRVTVSGETQTFPPSDVIVVPGVVRLERNLVVRTANGIQVTALRINLLDGSGAVFNLGFAKVGFSRAGL